MLLVHMVLILYSMICPSCLMFGAHKGHDVCKIDEGSKDLRNAINNSAKEGIMWVYGCRVFEVWSDWECAPWYQAC